MQAAPKGRERTMCKEQKGKCDTFEECEVGVAGMQRPKGERAKDGT